jgi:hypothetical protein
MLSPIAADRLMAHCIQAHGAGFQLLAHYCQLLSRYSMDERLTKTLTRHQKRLAEGLIRDFDQLGSHSGTPKALFVLSKVWNEKTFKALWDAAFGNPILWQAGKTAGELFRAAAFSRLYYPRALSLAESSLADCFRLFPEDLVHALVHYDHLGERALRLLDRLLTAHPVEASKLIVLQSQGPDPDLILVPQVTRILLDDAPNDPLTENAVGLCIDAEIDLVLSTIVRWINADNKFPGSFLEMKMREGKSQRVFEALAVDAIAREAHLQASLSERHQKIMRSPDVLSEWISKNLDRPEARRYSAGLVVASLSDYRELNEEQTNRLVELAQELHSRYGHRNSEEIRIEAKIPKDHRDFEILLAIGTAKDVRKPDPPWIDREALIGRYRQYPHTYEALGGANQLDKAIRTGRFPPFHQWYLWDGETFATFRQRWEERFEKIDKAGVKGLGTKPLRENPDIWPEIRLLAQLVGSFNAEYEPKGIQGMKHKKPEYLLKSPDGDLILEVASIGVKADDLLETAKVTIGGLAKKTLLNKWRDKFNKCAAEFALPIVIAVQARHFIDAVFDLPNSLYGPLQTSGRRNHKRGFFYIEGVRCISGILGVEADYASIESSSDDRCPAQFFRPPHIPTHPLHGRLWVRLRDALFGPMPQTFISEMSRIPGITSGEAEDLVMNGVDCLWAFAQGLFPYNPELKMSPQRFEVLCAQAFTYRRSLSRLAGD